MYLYCIYIFIVSIVFALYEGLLSRSMSVFVSLLFFLSSNLFCKLSVKVRWCLILPFPVLSISSIFFYGWLIDRSIDITLLLASRQLQLRQNGSRHTDVHITHLFSSNRPEFRGFQHASDFFKCSFSWRVQRNEWFSQIFWSGYSCVTEYICADLKLTEG